MLAGRLRASRLTVLSSPAGVDTTPMLLHGVMPKLRRRSSDRVLLGQAATGTVISFPDRRDSEAGLLARRDREIAVFFDAWNGDPATALLRQVEQAIAAPWLPAVGDGSTLTAWLADLQSRHDLRFLLLLDRFEDALAQRDTSPRVAEFIEQWLEALEAPGLAAHFLVALPEAELGRFEGVRERIAGFDDQVLTANGSGRLFGLSSVASPVPVDVRQAVAATSLRPATIEVLGTYADTDRNAETAFLESIADIGLRVAEVATETPPQESRSDLMGSAPSLDPPSQHDPALPLPPAAEGSGDGLGLERSFHASNPPGTEPALDPALPDQPDRAPEAAPTGALPFGRAPSYAWLALPLIAAAIWWWTGRDAPSPSTAVAPPERAASIARTQPEAPPATTPDPSVPVPVPVLVPLPAPDSLLGAAALDIAFDPSNGTDARIARELTASLAPAGGIELPALTSRGGLATLVDLDAASTSPRLAIANYDALQAARTLSLRPRLAIVTPLYRQEIYFLVRADSPLHFLHDLRGARIDAGPADGSRSLTAAAVYRQMFDSPLPGTPTAHTEDDALAELLAFRTIDAVATVGGQPLPWLEHLPQATRDRIRLLRLDSHDPAERRALQAFLPSTVHGPVLNGIADNGTPTLSVMSFLVTNAQPDDTAASAKLTAFAAGLCHALPALRQAGHPKWSEVRPGLSLPTGFADSPAAQAGFDDCRPADGSSASGRSTPGSSTDIGPRRTPSNLEGTHRQLHSRRTE